MPDQSSAATEHAILQEITQPLEALPDDPLAVVNAEFPTALRGYERMAVDEYVRTTRRLVAELQATRSPEAAVRRALERVGEQIAGILQRAHETAEQITAQSRSEAEDRLDQARAEGVQIAEAAEQRVRDLDADTDRIWLERQRIVADAEDLAAQLLALAKTAAERFPADAEADAAGGTPPYDDDAGVPMRAAEPSFASDEDDAYFDEEEPEPGRSEIERTVAFQPLEPTEFQPGGGGPPPAEVDSEPPAAEADSEPSAASASEEPSGADVPPAEPGEDSAPDTVPPKGSTSDDSTAVIPPASQAANRRRSQ
jgi:cell division septum initiation protein DivIVA